jgi:hypothetical protein
MAQLHSLRDKMLSARNLRRTGGSPHHVAALQSEAASVSEEIQRAYSFLAAPKISADGTAGRALTLNRLDGPKEYFFHSERELPPNRIHFIGIRCPRCQASVAQRQGLVSLGQGCDRVVVWSCHCLTFAAYQPPKTRVTPMTLEKWTQLGAATAEEDKDTQCCSHHRP